LNLNIELTCRAITNLILIGSFSFDKEEKVI
jgi:hypothetical protein